MRLPEEFVNHVHSSGHEVDAAPPPEFNHYGQREFARWPMPWLMHVDDAWWLQHVQP